MAIQNRLKILIAEKELRDGKRLSYRTISDEAGLSTSTLTAYVSQKVNRYDASTLEAICKYFGCQPGDLLTYTPDTEPGGAGND